MKGDGKMNIKLAVIFYCGVILGGLFILTAYAVYEVVTKGF